VVCLFTGLFGGFLVYLGQRVWPVWQTLPNLETAFMDVCRRVGGDTLFNAMGFTILVAQLGGGMAAVLAAARLLFGMGRDNVLPRKVFGHLSPGTNTPTYNILIVGVIAFVASMGLQRIGNAYEHAGELLNFGAFLRLHERKPLPPSGSLRSLRPGQRKPRIVADVLLPLFGCAFCGVIWWNLHIVAKIAGGMWFLIGLAYLAVHTGGFRRKPVMLSFGE